MPDDLRTRIAKVLYNAFSDELRGDYAFGWERESDYVKADYLDAADAVIRQLGLRRCTGQGPYANQVWYQTDWIIE